MSQLQAAVSAMLGYGVVQGQIWVHLREEGLCTGWLWVLAANTVDGPTGPFPRVKANPLASVTAVVENLQSSVRLRGVVQPSGYYMYRQV
jgi:multidrug efflux pump subunit AcrA (membrane-fusion protein)